MTEVLGFINTIASGIPNAGALIALVVPAAAVTKYLTDVIKSSLFGRTPQIIALGVSAVTTAAIFFATQNAFSAKVLGFALIVWLVTWASSIGTKELARTNTELVARASK